MDTTLLVMAAGMGSRFGGMKQLAPIGPNGEGMIDYAVFDAKRAGFNKAVFIITHAIEEEFRATVGKKAEKIIDVEYAFQEKTGLPEGREKPWGTGHAILSARDKVNSPFAVINADDYYGKNSYEMLARHLESSTDYAMIGFDLHKTLSENGTVTRGVCEIQDGYLKAVAETSGIGMDTDLPCGTVVSMNMWGFMPNLFDHLESEFEIFLSQHKNDIKTEFYIPIVVDTLIRSGKEKVKVLTSDEQWYGVTYREDLDEAKKAIGALMDKGIYNGI